MEEALYTPQRPAGAEVGTWDFDWNAQLSPQKIVKCPKCSGKVVLDVKFHCVGCGYHRRFPDRLHGTNYNWPDEDRAEWAKVACHENFYYQALFEGQLLWCRNKDYILYLIDYLGSKNRTRPYNALYHFLTKLPNWMVTADKTKIVKALQKLHKMT